MTDIRFSNITKETFKNELCKLLNKRGYKTKITVCNNADMPFENIVAYHDGDMIVPAMNLDALYCSYLKSNETALQDGCFCTMEEVIDFILENIENSKQKNMLPSEDEMMNVLRNWNVAKSRMTICLHSLESKQGYIKDVVHQIVAEDLVIIPYVQLNDIGAQCAVTTPVTNYMQTQWGLTTEEIVQAAKKSSSKLRPVEIININEMYKQVARDEGMPDFLVNAMCNSETSPEMHAVTCANRKHGAATIFYDGVIKKLYDSFGAFYVLPSSDAELIIISKDIADKFDLDAKCLQERVLDINQASDLFEENAEVLTDSVYFYDDTYGFRKIC